MRNLNLTTALAWLVMLALSLAACGGGDGGGGDAKRPVNPATQAGGSPVQGKAAKANQITAPDLTTGRLDFKGGGYILISQNYVTVKWDMLEPTFTIPVSEFNIHKNNLITYVGRQGNRDIIARLGGKNVGLEYSDFGVWLEANSIWAVGDNVALNGNGKLVYFILNPDAGKRAALKDDEKGFTGTALAYANNYIGNIYYVPLVGQAKLDMGTGGKGTLVLTFKDFYTLYGRIQTSGSDFAGTFYQVTENNNRTGIKLDQPRQNIILEPRMNEIVGASFGSGGTATEAVGAFSLESSRSGVTGSFGVKK